MQYTAGLIIVVAMPLYTAAILIGGARFIEETLKIDYNVALLGFAMIVAIYVIIGGLIAVMYTDALQGAIMLVGMTVLLVLTYVFLGGVVEAHTALTAMSNLVPESLAAGGLTGWTAMPVLGSPIWFTMVTTIILGVGIGVLAQPQLIVRFMTVKDSRSLNRAVLVGGPFILMMTGVAFTVGALTNVYFYQHSQQIALTVAGGTSIRSFPCISTRPCRTGLWHCSCSCSLRRRCPHSRPFFTRWAPHLDMISGGIPGNTAPPWGQAKKG